MNAILLRASAVALLLAPPCVAPVDAAVRRTRLSAEGQVWSDVSWFQQTPDGERVLYLHDAVTDDANELWVVRRDGTGRIRLSYPLPSGRSVDQFEATPDGRHVVFIAAQDSTSKELWRVPIEGPASSAQLLGPSPAAGDVDVRAFWFAAQGRIVYWAGDGTFERFWSVPEAGPADAAVEISPPLPPGATFQYVGGADISPDATRFVWTGAVGNSTGARGAVWSVPVEGPGTQAVRLTPEQSASNDLEFGFEISPDSSRVVYRADLDAAGRNEVWSVPIDGPGDSPERLCPVPVLGGDVSKIGFSADSSTVLFFGDVATDTRNEIWSVPIDGPWQDSIKLNPPPTPGGDVVYDLATTSAGGQNRVLFRGDLEVDGRIDLWSAHADGPEGSALSISGSVVAAGTGVELFRIADAQRVVFQGDLSRAGQDWLYSRALDGSGSRTTLTDLTAFPDALVQAPQVAPDGRFVAYEYVSSPGAAKILRRVPVAGGAVETLTPQVWPVFTSLDSFRVAADSRGVFFLADTSFDGALALWVADEWIFSANFEEGDESEWSSATL